MGIRFLFGIKLLMYWKIVCLMRTMSQHFSDKECTELIDYWEVVYKQKIEKLLKSENKRLFS